MSQAYRSRITTFDEEIRNGMRGFWIGWRSPQYTSAFLDTVAAIKALPTLFRAYDPDAKLWWVAVEALPDLARELTDLATYESRWRRLRSGNHYQDAPPRRAPIIPPDVEAAFTTLGLLPSAPKKLVEAARKVWATIHHPDHGGDLAAMKAINIAADKAVAWAERHQKAA